MLKNARKMMKKLSFVTVNRSNGLIKMIKMIKMINLPYIGYMDWNIENW